MNSAPTFNEGYQVLADANFMTALQKQGRVTNEYYVSTEVSVVISIYDKYTHVLHRQGKILRPPRCLLRRSPAGLPSRALGTWKDHEYESNVEEASDILSLHLKWER